MAAALAAFSCSAEPAPPRGDSAAFQAEVDDLQERNRALHEKSQQLEERFQPLESRSTALLDDLAPLSAQWAYDTHRSLDEALQRTRRALTDFETATGADLEQLGSAAEEAIADLEQIYQRARREVERRRSGLSATPPPPG